MKSCFLGLLAAWFAVWAIPAVHAATLTTNTGKVLHHAELKKIAAGRATITHEGGQIVLDLAELPENFIAALSVRQRYAFQSRIDLALADGRLLQGTNIVELGNDMVTFACSKGVVEVPAKLLPEYYLATFTARQWQALHQPKTTSSKDLHNAENAAAKDLQRQDMAPRDVPPATSQAGSSASTAANGKPVERDAEGHDIYVGPRGGRYYLTPDGKKVYLPKKKK